MHFHGKAWTFSGRNDDQGRIGGPLERPIVTNQNVGAVPRGTHDSAMRESFRFLSTWGVYNAPGIRVFTGVS